MPLSRGGSFSSLNYRPISTKGVDHFRGGIVRKKSTSPATVDDWSFSYAKNEFEGGVRDHSPHRRAALPSPRAVPRWSFHGRVLPSELTALDSPVGRRMLLESLLPSDDCGGGPPPPSAYYPLSQSFLTQSSPAACGPATLAMILNALRIDPGVLLFGGWRFYDESVVMGRCCVDMETMEANGITLEQFAALARCNGVTVSLRRPAEEGEDGGGGLRQFRADLREHLQRTDAFVVLSFSRSALGQTGDGHFSPAGAYHAPTDSVLVFDVARFKYGAYWVNLEALYESMMPQDPVTGRSRGWFLIEAPDGEASVTEKGEMDNLRRSPRCFSESKRPGEVVMKMVDPADTQHGGSVEVCPVGKFKIEYCPSYMQRRYGSNRGK
eukprot:CAMPEP_0113330878 /NCGR_PEP_ID=MMETSP0010_2-20120614/22031_1 /TAXON_ID=216773 ORGANISM="Corethron hystrix, Strain 308" /NCGR_SAMPLE_ID=MMETSP0010_2 /ASSEMBLY_ACC=CAM_ASM_000155 /LENGTH=380 /DNA_ID=CAMNT_0000193789 /DNA_START=485 /DNA_END=1627 /DNA_ORIENTATION=- /assembly_acc=CAM_ASM_000155